MEVSQKPKYQISALKIMAIHVQLHANVSKQCYWMALTFVPQMAPYVGVA